MYGVVGYKTHAKMMLVVRREAERHAPLLPPRHRQLPSAHRARYTDFGLFTCDDEIGQDVHELFLQLTSLTQTPKLHKPAAVAVRPARSRHREDRARGASMPRAGKPGAHHRQDERAGRPQVIEALYRASQAGVQIDLIVRGVCALRPGFPACPRTSACARSSAASSSTRACSISRTAASREMYLRERRLDGAQLLPPHRGRIPDAARRRIASASCAIWTSTCATTRRPGTLRTRRQLYQRCDSREANAPIRADRELLARSTQPGQPLALIARSRRSAPAAEDPQPKADRLAGTRFPAAGPPTVSG